MAGRTLGLCATGLDLRSSLRELRVGLSAELRVWKGTPNRAGKSPPQDNCPLGTVTTLSTSGWRQTPDLNLRCRGQET